MGRLRAWGVAAIWLLANGAVAPLSLHADDQLQMAMRLEKAEGETSIDTSGLLPWHLKVSFTTEAVGGQKAESGTIEEWWAGPMARRVVFTSPSFSATEIQNKDGFFRTAGAPITPYLLKMVLGELVHPLPSRAIVEYSELHLLQRKVGDLQLDCVSVVPPKKTAESNPLEFPTHCFTKGSTQLVVSYDYATLFTTRLRAGKFQGRTVPLEVTAGFNGEPTLRAKVEALAGMAMPPDEFVPAEGMTQSSSPPVQVDGRAVRETGPEPRNGGAISQPSPQLPAGAKRHGSGKVLVRALIGKDGHVKDVAAIYASDPAFERPALDAVRRWVYSPYLVSGEPTEVETTLPVNFQAGP